MSKWEEPDFDTVMPSEKWDKVAEWNWFGSYEGSGWAIGRNLETGLFCRAEYSHCSCYGPAESMDVGDNYPSAKAAARTVGTDRDRLPPELQG